MTKRFKRTEEMCILRGKLAAMTGLTGHELDSQLKAEKWLPEDHKIARKSFNEVVEVIILGDNS